MKVESTSTTAPSPVKNTENSVASPQKTIGEPAYYTPPLANAAAETAETIFADVHMPSPTASIATIKTVGNPAPEAGLTPCC